MRTQGRGWSQATRVKGSVPAPTEWMVINQRDTKLTFQKNTKFSHWINTVVTLKPKKKFTVKMSLKFFIVEMHLKVMMLQNSYLFLLLETVIDLIR